MYYSLGDYINTIEHLFWSFSMLHSIIYCGDFNQIAAFSKPDKPHIAVKLRDNHFNKTYLFKIDGNLEWNGLDDSIKINQLRSVLLANGVRMVSENVTLQ